MAKDKQYILEKAVSELKSMCSGLDALYNSLKNRFALFSSGQLAYLAFIYGSAAASAEQNQLKRLFFPAELSSQIFYIIGIVFAFLSLCFLFQGFLPVDWEVPPQSADLKKLDFKDKTSLLTYLRDQYYNAIQANGATFELKCAVYTKGLFFLVIGDVILFVIRFFGNILTGG